jgi:hypothetical protein
MINRLLSGLHLCVFALTGRGNHWRNDQDFGLLHLSNKTIEDNEFLKRLLGGDSNPIFVGRYGTTELKEFLRYYRVFNLNDNNVYNIIKSILFSEPKCWGIDTDRAGKTNLQILSGVFPSNEEEFNKFKDTFYEASKELDILASWQVLEKYLFKYDILCKEIRSIDYNILEYPYRLETPWTYALQGKKILIVSLFASDISGQIENGNYLRCFSKPLFNKCSFVVYQSENTAGYNGDKSRFKDWTEALEYMKSNIKGLTFDIALLGCGAYAFPLASFIKKEMGKTSITVCGALQTYFGIYGERTKNLPEINQFWVRPDQKFRVDGFKAIENGAYW